MWVATFSSASRIPMSHKMREALEDTRRPAPTYLVVLVFSLAIFSFHLELACANSADASKTLTLNPFWIQATAADRPVIPHPTITTSSLSGFVEGAISLLPNIRKFRWSISRNSYHSQGLRNTILFFTEDLNSRPCLVTCRVSTSDRRRHPNHGVDFVRGKTY